MARLLDLKGTPCPINYAKAKIALEKMKPGEELEILLDKGEPFANVPMSLQADGHEILKREQTTDASRIIVRKKNGST